MDPTDPTPTGSAARSVLSIGLLDDDDAFRSIIKIRLEAILGTITFAEFTCLADVRNAAAVYKTSSFDLVILDQHLPDGRGVSLLQEGFFSGIPVLAVSSDVDPEIPGSVIGAGAGYFLPKTYISDPLFAPLVRGLIERSKLQHELDYLKRERLTLETVKTLVSTLRHEINNPLGGVLGGAYLLKNRAGLSADDRKAAEIVETSGNRIKHVLDELCNAIALQPVTKGGQQVFHIPGDKKWD